MAQYIDKSAAIAEIENKINKIDLNSIEDWRYRLQREHDIEVMKNIISIINTLEVKEVDLEKEIKNAINEYYDDCEKKLQEMDDNDTDMSFLQLDKFAKHFFELGLQSQNEEKIVAEEEGTCNKILNRIVGKSWNIICPVYEMNVNNGEKVKIRIIKGE